MLRKVLLLGVLIAGFAGLVTLGSVEVNAAGPCNPSAQKCI